MTRRAMARLGAIVLTAASPSALARADGTVRVTFFPAAEVDASVIRLRDVARIRCADPQKATAVADLEVGASPAIGFARTLSASYARIRLRSLGIRDENIAFAGAETVTVTHPGQTVPGADLEKAARTAAESANPGCAAQPFAPVRDQLVSRGRVEILPQSLPPATGTTTTVSLQVRVDGRREATIAVGVRLLRRAPILVATRPLRAGEILTPDDFRQEERPIDSSAAGISDPAQAVGRQVGAPIAAGAPLTAGALRTVPLVRRGARVRVICRGAAFAIACAAEALQDGAAGETIRVRNSISQLEFTARVVETDLLEVIY